MVCMILKFKCLWFLLVLCRAIYATDEVGETCEDPGSLLCAPKRLLPSGSCYSAVSWHGRETGTFDQDDGATFFTHSVSAGCFC